MGIFMELENVAHALSLPDEIWMIIFSYLSHTDVGVLSRVCKRLHSLTSDQLLWANVFLACHGSKKLRAYRLSMHGPYRTWKQCTILELLKGKLTNVEGSLYKKDSDFG